MPRLPFGKFFKKSTISADSHVAGDDGSYVRCYDMKAGDKMEPGLRIGSLVPDDKPEITVPDETMTSTPSQLYAPPVETETMDITSPPVEMKAMELENIAPLPGRKTKNKYFLPVVAGLALLSGTAAILAVSQALSRQDQEALNAVQAVYNNDEYDQDGRQVFAYVPGEIVNRALDTYEDDSYMAITYKGMAPLYVIVNTQVDGGGTNYTIGMDMVETEQVSVGVSRHKNFYQYKGYGHTPDTYYYIECSTSSYSDPNNCVAYIQDTSPATYDDNFYSERFLENGPFCKHDGDTCSSDHDCCADDCDGGKCECFSARATVSVKSPISGEIVKMPMSRLQIGDLVMVGSDKFQRVYGFSHKTDSQIARFLQIYLEDANDPLEMTPSHFAFVVGKDGPVPASQLQVGDRLHNIFHGENEIIKIETVTHDDGLYSPLTSDGTIVVNDLLMSTYNSKTSYVEVEGEGEIPSWQFAGFKFTLTHNLIHRAFTPFRMFCESFPSSTSCTEDNGPSQLGIFIFKDVPSFFSGHHVLVQWAVLSVYIVVIFLAVLIESLLLVNGIHVLLFAFAISSVKKACRLGK